MRLGPKRVILLLIVAFFLAIVGFLAISLLGPSTPVAISRQTTYLTGPIDPYGRIDYVEALRREWSEGVTPENNAAVLIWQALGPAEIPPERQPSFFAELGIPPLPLVGDYFVELDSDRLRPHIVPWMQEHAPLPTDRPSQQGMPPDPDLSAAELQATYQMHVTDAHQGFMELAERARRTAWTSQEMPPLAEWLRINEGPLALVVEASGRPRYFSPLIVSSVGPGTGPLYSMLIPDVQHARSLARALCWRAMLRLGEGAPAEAWRDLQASHRLARLIGSHGVLISQLVAIAIDQMTLLADAELLHAGDLPEDEARKVYAFLMNLGPPSRMAASIDKVERIMGLDTILHAARHGLDENAMGIENFVLRTGVDWNIPMQIMNKWYDRIAEAAGKDTIEKRRAAMAGVEGELAALRGNITPGRLAKALFSKGTRSELVGEVMVGLLLPALNAAQEAEDRASASLRLVQVAAALAVHRSAHGDYPQVLTELDPELLEKLPDDPFARKPFLYERRGNGYVLWSVGPNLQDDAASGSALCHTRKGDFIAEDAPRDGNEDDIVLRVPWAPTASPED